MSGDASSEGDGGGMDLPPTPEQAETDWGQIIYRLARLKAELSRAERHLARDDSGLKTPHRAKSAVSFVASDFNTLIEKVVEYVEGGDLPETCPVCGEAVVPPGDLEAGESYEPARFCVTEQGAGLDHGIIHFEEGGES
jgi:hypothetical protein